MAEERGTNSGSWKAVSLAASVLLVVMGLVAPFLTFEAAPVDSDATHAWGGLIPVAYLGMAGLRRRGVLLAIAGGLFAVVVTLAGVVLLQMNHVSAGVLIVLGAIGAAEAAVLLFLLRGRVTAAMKQNMSQ